MSETPHPQYPVYVLSKGRATTGQTAKFLIQDGVRFSIVVEPQEAEEYQSQFGSDIVLVLPHRDIGQAPTRNWIWEHSKAAGFTRHWILDDNISEVNRLYKNKRLRINAGIAFRIVEDFTERYTNIGMTGLNYTMFVGMTAQPPIYLNTHAYSCLLIRNDLPQRWRGRYNEDTDLNLQILSAGQCIVTFNAFSIQKKATMTMSGGNTAMYDGDGRLKMSKSLERDWPGIVTTERRFHRPQHVIRRQWKDFDTQLIRRTDIDWDALKTNGPNNYGMKLTQTGNTQSPYLRELLAQERNNTHDRPNAEPET